mmetsp:Transcript_6981/g.17840  ORF Transcript_6981/g.17840 Transcript_6981/m.17840 type:complete len:220 (+) Transcript_6981:5519-6178(+)
MFGRSPIGPQKCTVFCSTPLCLLFPLARVREEMHQKRHQHDAKVAERSVSRAQGNRGSPIPTREAPLSDAFLLGHRSEWGGYSPVFFGKVPRDRGRRRSVELVSPRPNAYPGVAGGGRDTPVSRQRGQGVSKRRSFRSLLGRCTASLERPLVVAKTFFSIHRCTWLPVCETKTVRLEFYPGMQPMPAVRARRLPTWYRAWDLPSHQKFGRPPTPANPAL